MDVRARTEAGAVTPDLLRKTVEDFIPPTYPTEIELQTYAAVLEWTSRALLPERYRDLSREDVVRRVQALKREVEG